MCTEKSIGIRETNLPLQLLYRGKVRDVYFIDEEHLLIVTTDRVSAFDTILDSVIPNKGKILNQITSFWFNFLKDIVKNHFITSDINKMGLSSQILDASGHILEGRSMLVKKVQPLSIECIVRGYLIGSSWKGYIKNMEFCEHKLPPNMNQYSQFSNPIFTPSSKSSTGHDENISVKDAKKLENPDYVEKVQKLSMLLYKKGDQYAQKKGIIIADTKFEFGYTNNGEIILIDEVLTPDSSRFWLHKNYKKGDYRFLDKQIIRDYLSSCSENQIDKKWILPDYVIEKVTNSYLNIHKMLLDKV